ncbi:hypothetical protein Trydic_g6954 [Trypoxylus dichotomus]
MVRCAVCDVKSSIKITYFSFPKTPSLCEKWVKACGWSIHSDNDTSKVKLCDLHFDPDSFLMTRIDGPKKLKDGAIPTIFPHRNRKHFKSLEKYQSDTVSSTHTEHNSVVTSTENDLLNIVESALQVLKKRKIWEPRQVRELKEGDKKIPKQISAYLNMIKKEVTKKDRKIRCLIQRNYCLQKEAERLLSEQMAHILKKT